MEKRNRILWFELLLALLFIAAFFLPWLDWGLLKISGWDIPEMQKKITKVTNFIKFFSKNKDWIYSTHIVYIIPLLSVVTIIFGTIMMKKTTRICLLLTGLFGAIISANLFYKLPKAGSGVYLLTAVSVVSIVYLSVVLKKKKNKPEIETVLPVLEEMEKEENVELLDNIEKVI